MKFVIPRISVTPPVTRLAAALVGIAMLAWAGMRSSRVGDERRTELRRAEATLATFADRKSVV